MEIRNRITAKEANEIVNAVVDGCFIDGEYTPFNYGVTFDLYKVIYYAPDYFADKEINVEQFYEDIDKDEELIEILTTVNEKCQVWDIAGAIKDKIDFELSKLANPLNNELAKFVDKLSSTIDKLGNVVTPETLDKIMPALVNIGKLTDINQETVVKEVVSALKPKTTRKKATK